MFESRLSFFIFVVFFAILGYEPATAQPNAVLEVEVQVENGGNVVNPKTASDFRFRIERNGEATPFTFRGSESGVVIPTQAHDRNETELSITVLESHPGYVPIFEGACEPEGRAVIFLGERLTCRVTMAFLSFREEDEPYRVVKFTSAIDAPGERPGEEPGVEDFQYRVETADGFTASFNGSPNGVLIGLTRESRTFGIEVGSDAGLSRYLATFSDECGDFRQSRYIKCRIAHSLVHERIDPEPDSILKLRWEIKRFDPTGEVMPSLSDFDVEVLNDGQDRIIRLRGSETDTNLAVAVRSRTRQYTIEPIRGGRLARYVPYVNCGDGFPVADVAPATIHECLIEYYWVDHLVSETADRLISVEKFIENAGLPGETDDVSAFVFEILNSDGRVVTTFRGSEDGYVMAGVSTESYRVVESPIGRYMPIYSPGCGVQGDPRVSYFRDCEVTNYSVVEGEANADAIIRVRTTVDSAGDPDPPPPTSASFITSILRDGSEVVSQPGSPTFVNFGVRAHLSHSIEVSTAGRYRPLLAPRCVDLDLRENDVVECEVTAGYVLEYEDENSQTTIRITKTVDNTIGTDRPRTPSDFRLGVFEAGAVEPLFGVPGSATGVYVAGSRELLVRELNSGPDYAPIYSGDCFGVERVRYRDCRVANVFVGAVPPQAMAQTVTLPEDTNRPIVLSAIDPNSSSLAYQIVSGPTRGTLTGTAPNLIYTPNSNFNGTDSFVFRARDAQFDSNDAVVTINVTPVNDAPVASGRSVTAITETSTPFALTATDVDGNILTASVVSGPTNGTVSFNGLTATYTSRNDFFGSDSFTFRVSDGQVFSNTATVTVTVQNGIAVSNVSVAEGNAGTGQMVFSVELLAPSLTNVTVNFVTQNGTALAGSDYTARSGTVTFVRGGPLVIGVPVEILSDRVFEQSEFLRLNLSSPSGAVLRNNFVTGTILNDDLQVGIASMSPTELTVDALTPFTIDLTWIHPERWRLLDEIEFRIVDRYGLVAMWVKFDENGNELPFRQYHPLLRRYGDPALPGSNAVFKTIFAKMFVAVSLVVGSGPTGPSATVKPSLQFNRLARGRTFRVELFVSDDLGNQQGWEHVGNISVR